MLLNKIVLSKLLFSTIFSINILFVKYNSITGEWIKYNGNPVFGNDKIGSVFDPFVIKDNNIYNMYLSWRKKGAIALTKSIDGINWSNLKII